MKEWEKFPYGEQKNPQFGPVLALMCSDHFGLKLKQSKRLWTKVADNGI